MKDLEQMKNFLKRAKNFRNDEKGNFGALTALTFVPFAILLGGSIDVLRVTNAKSVLQNSVDTAVLAAASLTNTSDIDTIVQEYMDANLPSDGSIGTVNYEVVTSNVTTASREVEVTATVEVMSAFLSLAGIDSTTVEVSSSASQRASKFEISMVLDISTSMRGSKLTKLKSASKDFIDQVMDEDSLLDLISVNLIPYGGTVNIGPLFDTYAVPLTGSYTIEDPDGVEVSGVTTISDPSPSEYTIGSEIENSAFRFSEGLNCIETRHSDADDSLIPENSRSQVPHFSVWSSNTNPWCPKDDSASIWNTSDVDALHDRIDEMSLSDGTGSDIGLLWGTKSLSPDWRGKLGGDFPDRPADYDDEDTTKIMVLMTDGGITYQGRPKETPVGLEKYKPRNLQKPVNTGSYTGSSTADTAYGRFKTLCEKLEADGVKVFTIGFQIGATSNAAKQLEDCAVNGGAYYLVDSLDIGAAFEAISSSISNLRITG